jgi:hypothetical protein
MKSEKNNAKITKQCKKSREAKGEQCERIVARRREESSVKKEGNGAWNPLLF